MTGEKTEQKKNRNKALKALKWIFIFAAGLVLLFFFGLPLYLSSSGGTNFLLGKINQALDGQVGIGDLSVGWFKGVKLTDLSYTDSTGSTSVAIDRFESQPKYFSLLGGKVKLGKTILENPQMYLRVPMNPDEVSVSDKIEPSEDESVAPSPVFPVNQINLELINGSATVELTGKISQKVSVTNISSMVQIADAGKASSVDISMDVDDTSNLSVKGSATVSKKGWTLEDGDFNVQILKLQLASLKPLFVLAGYKMGMSGEVNANATVQIEQNQIQKLNAHAVISDFIQKTGDQRVVFEKPIAATIQAGQQGETLKIETLKVESEFCSVICAGTLESMDYAIDADLAQTQRFIEPFMDTAGASIAGAMSARGRVGMTHGQLHLISENSKIQQLKIMVPNSEPFVQDQVTLDADVLMGMGDNTTIDVRSLTLWDSQRETLINITKGAVNKKVGTSETQLSGYLEAEYDWQVLSAFASAYLPEGLTVGGKRKDVFNFVSKYPTDTPEEMLANLDADGAIGFDRADYYGLHFGPTELKMNIRTGILDFEIPQAAVNNGKLQLVGIIDLNEEPKVLRLKEAMPVLDAIHINEQMTNTMLKYLSPVFAKQSNISGFVSLMCNKLEVPFDLDQKEKILLDGVVEMDKIRLEAIGAVGNILSQTSNRSEFDARLLPTRILLQSGVMQYDSMEFHLDKYPTGFSGKIYLDKALDMEVYVPYKFDVERLRFPTVKIGDDLSDRLPLPVEGTADNPEVRVDKLFESIIKKHSPELIQKGIEELLRNL
jgi:hypothetical protein